MGEPQITFGDKFFISGEFTRFLYLFDDFEEIDVEKDGQKIHGFLVEILSARSLAVETPFNQVEAVDVTDTLSPSLLLPSGTRVWMLTTNSPEVHSPHIET